MSDKNNNQKIYLPVFLCLAVVFFGMQGFYLFPPSIVSFIPGFFRFEDFVFIIMIISLIYAIYTKRLKSLASHTFVILILLISILILLNPLLAKINFGQSYFKGLLSYRHWFNYFLFFVFITFLDSDERLKKFLNLLFVMILLIGMLSIVQYLIPTFSIFNYYEDLYLDNPKMRLGTNRLIYPVYDLGVLLYCILFSSIFISKKPTRQIEKVIIMLSILFLFYITQTRMLLIGILFVSLLGFFSVNHKKILVPTFIIVIVVLLFVNLLYTMISGQYFFDTLKESNFFKLIEMSYSELSKIEGNAGLRLDLSSYYWEYFMKYPIFGTGTTLLETPLNVNNICRPTTDVGLFRFIAEFGITGLLWFIALCLVWFKTMKNLNHILNDDEDFQYYYCLVRGLQLYFFYILITFFNFGHFIAPRRILIVVLVLALVDIIQRIVAEKIKLRKIKI